MLASIWEVGIVIGVAGWAGIIGKARTNYGLTTILSSREKTL